MNRGAARATSWLCGALLLSCAPEATHRPGAEPKPSQPGHGQTAAAEFMVDEPRVPPRLPEMSEDDRDGDRIADELQATLQSAGASVDARVPVEVLFSSRVTREQLRRFERAGGRVRHVYRAVAYGFTGTLPRGAVTRLNDELGPSLLTIAGAQALEARLDQATRNGRARPVWTAGFAGSSAGYSGDATITIAIVDSGVDASHADLSGRMAYFHDYSEDAEPSAADLPGHGTFVAGIAVGSGTSSGSTAGALHYTQSGDESGLSGSGEIYPVYYGSSGSSAISLQASWLGGGNANLMMLAGTYGQSAGTFSMLGAQVSGATPQMWSNTVQFQDRKFSAFLQPPSAGAVTRYAIGVWIASYPAIGDGERAMRGVCSGCRFAGLKVFQNDFTGSSLALAEALDDAVALAEQHTIKVVSMSIGTAGSNAALLTKVESAVQNGVVAVIAVGNSGPSGTIAGVARATSALTVGATNDDNALTDYTSLGAAGGDGLTMKPDLVAPGGSVYGSSILSLDTNQGEAGTLSLTDMVADDYTISHGTSAATPFVAGAAALVIDALQQNGLTWSWDSSAHPLRVKTLLCATATETNAAREGSVNSPTLGRASQPKDISEGYGILNPDAAIEAATVALSGAFGGSTTGTSVDRRAWARSVPLGAGTTLSVDLEVDALLDVDLYLYRDTPDAWSEPVILASSTATSSGTDESLSYTSSTAQTGLLVVKRVSGMGSFTATNELRVCGDNQLDAGEECDDGNLDDGDCCSSTCTEDENGTGCSSGDACQLGEVCTAGVCGGGTPKVCTASDACHIAGSCNALTGECSNPVQTDGYGCDDGNACTQTDSCQQGSCVGANPVVCTTPSSCQASVCNPSSGQCQLMAEPNLTTCDDGNACTDDDRCEDGACTGTARTCAAPDACHEAGSCDPQSGDCSDAKRPDGSACDDGNACTEPDSCRGGVCGGAPVRCAAGPCRSSACDARTGRCEESPLPDGLGCDDGNACTEGDRCEGGECKPGEAKGCAAPDRCHLAGSCDPGSGECEYSLDPDAPADCRMDGAAGGPGAETLEPARGARSGSAAAPAKGGCSVGSGRMPVGDGLLGFVVLLVLARARRRADLCGDPNA